MLESFSSEGHWKLPNEERTFSGTLEYNPSEGGYLKLIGLIKEGTEVGKIVDKRDIIHGITIDGKKLTLCNCIETKTSFANGVFSSTYWIQMIIVGLLVNTQQEIKFRSVKARISFIDQWINKSGIEERRNANNYEILIKSFEPIKSNISSELLFEFIPTYNIHSDRITGENKPLDLSVSQHFDVKLTFVGTETFDKYLTILNK
jgi:ApeA N-terminal domain 1